MRRFKCLFRRHDWHSTYDRETNDTTRECRRCGVIKRGSGTDLRGTIFGVVGGSGG